MLYHIVRVAFRFTQDLVSVIGRSFKGVCLFENSALFLRLVSFVLTETTIPRGARLEVDGSVGVHR